jgi:hypothetical protein
MTDVGEWLCRELQPMPPISFKYVTKVEGLSPCNPDCYDLEFEVGGQALPPVAAAPAGACWWLAALLLLLLPPPPPPPGPLAYAQRPPPPTPPQMPAVSMATITPLADKVLEDPAIGVLDARISQQVGRAAAGLLRCCTARCCTHVAQGARVGVCGGGRGGARQGALEGRAAPPTTPAPPWLPPKGRAAAAGPLPSPP